MFIGRLSNFSRQIIPLSSGSQVELGNPIATQAELGAFPMPSTAWRAMTRSQAQLGNEENNP